MSRTFGNFSSVGEVLQGLIDQQVTIILISGQRICGCIDAVLSEKKVYNDCDGSVLSESESCGCTVKKTEKPTLLVMSACNRVVFVNIECICAVLTCCEEVFEFALNNMRGHKRSNLNTGSRGQGDMFCNCGHCSSGHCIN